MSSIFVASLAALAVFVLLLFGAVVELHRQILQLREYSGLVDHARPLTFNSGVELPELRIPAARAIGEMDRTAVLILSDGCSTCYAIARHLASIEAAGLMVLVEARSQADATSWLARYALREDDSIVYDDGGLIAHRLGLNVTPSIVKFEGHRPVAATTIPSTRQLDRIINWLSGSGMEPSPVKEI